MAAITFYRQARQDGGIRTGVEVEDETVLGRFEQGPDDANPALLWYVDVICEGESLPADAEGARQWLIANAGWLRGAIMSLAGEVRAGVDINSWPLRWQMPGPPSGLSLAIICSAVRRVAAQQLAQTLEDIADHWQDWVRNLPAVQAA